MKQAIVTGHTRGLGEALARLLEGQGWNVLGLARQGDPAIDLSDPAALQAWLDGGDLVRFLSGASEVLLVNNAGTVAPAELVGHQPVADVVAAVNLNVTAPLLLTDAVLRLRPQGVPVRVAHISSGAGRHAYPGWSVYCATKAAIDRHVEALAAEGHEGVRVAAIAPGIVDTAMQAAIRDSSGFPLREQFVDYKERGQLASPADAAAAVLAVIESPDFGSRVLTDVRG